MPRAAQYSSASRYWSNGVLEYWSNVKSRPRNIRVSYIICAQLSEIAFYPLHLKANGQAAIFIITRFKTLGLKKSRHSGTPTPQYSNTPILHSSTTPALHHSRRIASTRPFTRQTLPKNHIFYIRPKPADNPPPTPCPRPRRPDQRFFR